MYQIKLEQKQYGVFSLIMSVYMFAVTIATSGLSIACTSIVSRDFAQGNFLLGLKAVRSTIIFALLLGLGTGSIIILTANLITKFCLKNMISNVVLYLIAFGLPFIAISCVINGYFSAVRKSYKSAFSQIFELAVKIVVTVILLKFYVSKGVESICICLILADVISEVCSFTLLLILYKFDKQKYNVRKIKQFTYKKKILKITLPISITSYIKSGLSTLKQFIIPSRLMAFGLSYSMALSEYGKITGMVMPVIMFSSVFINSFSSLLIPEFSTFQALNNKSYMKKISKKIFKISGTFSFLIAIILFFFANDISYFVFQNIDCAYFIRLLSPLVVFMYLDNVVDSILKGLNKQVGVMICNILDLIITILLLYFLLPILGINGYIVVIYVSEIFNFSFSFWQLYTAFSIP